MKKITTQNWYAWINKQQIQPTTYGTLHVTGETITHPSKVAVLVKKNPQGINSQILLLEIVLHPSGIPTKQPQQLHYVETLVEENQYSSIEVFYLEEKIITITDIPVVS